MLMAFVATTIFVAILLPMLVYAGFYWLFSEACEEERAPPPGKLVLDFCSSVVWHAFSRWLAEKPLMISSRRDSRGRFRKML